MTGSPAGAALAGRRVAITRAASQAAALADRLRAAGAEPVVVPLIRIVAVDGDEAGRLGAAARRLGGYDWLVLTSRNAVAALQGHRGRDEPFPSGLRIACVGPGTAHALASLGVEPDLVPPAGTASSLCEALVAVERAADRPPRVLLPQAASAGDVLASGLRGAGWQVDVVVAYRTEPLVPDQASLDLIAGADAVAVTSGSQAAALASALGAAGRRLGDLPPVVCIGPSTADVCRRRGIDVAGMAREHSLDGVVEAVAEALGGRPGQGGARAGGP